MSNTQRIRGTRPETEEVPDEVTTGNLDSVYRVDSTITNLLETTKEVEITSAAVKTIMGMVIPLLEILGSAVEGAVKQELTDLLTGAGLNEDKASEDLLDGDQVRLFLSALVGWMDGVIQTGIKPLDPSSDGELTHVPLPGDDKAHGSYL